MIGVINTCLEEFVTESFGEETWCSILSESRVEYPWVTTCTYADDDTYTLVTVAAKKLGISLEGALEAYGVFFVGYVQRQGYSRLLSALGATLPEFFNNLNALHMHLLQTFPQMRAPSFRCTDVTPESLDLHYHSERPLLGPLVTGICKGVAKTFFHHELDVEAVQLRGRDEGAQHDVFRLKYPYTELIKQTVSVEASCERSMHPFHMVFSEDGRLRRWGNVLGRLFPDLRHDTRIWDIMEMVHPHIGFSWDEIRIDMHSPFLLRSRRPGAGAEQCLTLKGAMMEIELEGTQGMVFYGSPRCGDLGELIACRLFLSDLPNHDVSRDYILLAEQRSIETELKAKLEATTHELRAEKLRSDALVQRMSVLLSCFPTPEERAEKKSAAAAAAAGAAAPAAGAGSVSSRRRGGPQAPGTGGWLSSGSNLIDGALASGGSDVDHVEVIEAVRRSISQHPVGTQGVEDIELRQLLSEGAYGKVYRGLWQGTEVAIKTQLLAGGMSADEKREKMAVMETAISSTLSHPNIVQTYTYTIRPITETDGTVIAGEVMNKDNKDDLENLGIMLGGSVASMSLAQGGFFENAMDSSMGLPDRKPSVTSDTSGGGSVMGYEIRLVLELCDYGSLRDCLDSGAYRMADGSPNLAAVLDTAIDCAKAMVHMHRQDICHSDLKSRNVMLKSSGRSSVVAKIGDFGLSVHVEKDEGKSKEALFQGTLTHMAPEIMTDGHVSPAADVYAFGIMLWEMYTSKHPFVGMPKNALAHKVCHENKRPVFPDDADPAFVRLAEWCWSGDASARPAFVEVLATLQSLRRGLGRTPQMALPDPLPPLSELEDDDSSAMHTHMSVALPLPGEKSKKGDAAAHARSRLSTVTTPTAAASAARPPAGGICPMGHGGGGGGLQAAGRRLPAVLGGDLLPSAVHMSVVHEGEHEGKNSNNSMGRERSAAQEDDPYALMGIVTENIETEF
mmetsp:Transcript_38872/g.115659  ORF Transcript_38872/g.115659 Transcript_38872/m.115659 type:complete len:959 (-) Transcript_38872:492-3368(-)